MSARLTLRPNEQPTQVEKNVQTVLVLLVLSMHVHCSVCEDRPEHPMVSARLPGDTDRPAVDDSINPAHTRTQ